MADIFLPKMPHWETTRKNWDGFKFIVKLMKDVSKIESLSSTIQVSESEEDIK